MGTELWLVKKMEAMTTHVNALGSVHSEVVPTVNLLLGTLYHNKDTVSKE